MNLRPPPPGLRFAVSLMGAMALALIACGDPMAGAPQHEPDSSPGETPIVWHVPGHNSPIYAVAVDPGRSRIAAAGYGRVLGILDASTGDEIDWRSGTGEVGGWTVGPRSVAWSGDGALLVVDDVIRSGDTYQKLATIDGTAMAFSPDSSRVAGIASDCSCLAIWSALSGTSLFRDLGGALPEVARMSWHPDGVRVAVAIGSGSYVVDTNTGDAVRDLPPAEALAWSPDGARLALVGGDRGAVLPTHPDAQEVLVLDVRSWAPLARRSVHSAGANDVVWLDGGARLATGGGEGSIRIMDADTLADRASIDVPPGVTDVDVTIDGQTLVVGTFTGRIVLIDLDALAVDLAMELPGGRVLSLALSPDGATLATGGLDQTVRIWSAATGDLIHESFHDAYINDLAWTHDGAWLVVAAETVKALDAADYSEVDSLTSWWAPELAVAPDENLVAVKLPAAYTFSDEIWVIDVESGQTLVTYDPDRYLGEPAWSPDGRYLATWRYPDGDIVVVDVSGSTAIEVSSFQPALETVLEYEWTPDGSGLVVAGGFDAGRGDRRVLAYAYPSWELDLALGYSSDGWINDVGVTADGRQFYAVGTSDRVFTAGPDFGNGDGYAFKVWEASDGDLVFGVGDLGTLGAAAVSRAGDVAYLGSWSGSLTKVHLR